MPEENPAPNAQGVNDINPTSTEPNTNTINPNPNVPATTAINPNPADGQSAVDPVNAQQTTASAQPTASPEPAQPNTPQSPIAPETPAPKSLAEAPAPMSSPIMKSTIQKPKNKLLPVVLILIILTLAGIGTSIFAFIQSSDKDTEIARLRSELANQGIILPTTPDDNNTQPTTPEQPEITSAIRAQILASVPTYLVLSDAKSINTTGEMTYSTGGSFDNAFSASLDLSNNQPALSLNWDRIKEIYPYLTTDKTGTENISDLGLSGKPTDMLLTGFGQAVGYEVLFFLMEDGTVEYIPLAKATKEGNIKSYGKLNNITNVIKFYSGSSCSKTGPGCGMQSLAQRADGNYYELYEAVKVTGNFDL